MANYIYSQVQYTLKMVKVIESETYSTCKMAYVFSADVLADLSIQNENIHTEKDEIITYKVIM